jgi:hypothetical protein
MMYAIKRSAMQLPVLAIALLLAIALALYEPGKAIAQNVTGTGTIGKVPKWTAGSVLGDSVISEASGNLGIGITSPTFPLSFGTGIGNKLALYETATGQGYGFGIQSSLLQIFTNTASDRVGIGYGNSGSFTETLSVKGGSVGIGTINPAANGSGGAVGAIVQIQGGTNTYGLLNLANDATYLGANAGTIGFISTGTSGGDKRAAVIISTLAAVSDTNVSGNLLFYTNNTGTVGERMRIDNLGNIGIGTSSPAERLEVNASVANSGLIVKNTGVGASSGAVITLRAKNATLGDTKIAQVATATEFFSDAAAGDLALRSPSGNAVRLGSLSNGASSVTILSNGNIGIGTTNPGAKLDVGGGVNVNGSVTVTGNIAAKYQDVAEWVPSRVALEAGTVVVLDTEHTNQVMASYHAYDTGVAGVISERPGVILGEGGAGKLLVATTGRVKVKVDATSAPIRVGDLLVSSDKAGIAMRSQPIDLGGTPIHRPGTIIGKALQPLNNGVGEILVLLSLQ